MGKCSTEARQSTACKRNLKELCRGILGRKRDVQVQKDWKGRLRRRSWWGGSWPGPGNAGGDRLLTAVPTFTSLHLLV